MVAVAAVVALKVVAGATIGQALLSAVVSFALGQIASALRPKPAVPENLGTGSIAAGRTQSIRNPVVSRRNAVGTVILGGAMTCYAVTANKQYHHIVWTICDGVVEFGTFWISDEPYNMEDLDENGMVTTGRFANLVRLKFHTGTDDQEADADFVSEVSPLLAWVDENFRGRGVAYVYSRIDWDRSAMPNGLPGFRFTANGVVYDTRLSADVVSDNAALSTRRYVVDTRNGLGAHGAAATDFAASEFDAAANVSDEIAATKDIDTAVTGVDVSGNSLELEGDRVKYFTGDRAEILTTGTAPAGLSTETDYFIIVVNRALGGGGASPVRVKLATSLVNARAGTAIDITDTGSGDHVLRKTGEPRYRASGMIESKDTPQTSIDKLLNAMNGGMVYSGGRWVLLPGAYRTPVLDLDESDLRGPIAVQTRHGRRDRCNTIKGKYATPFDDGEDSEYPTVVSSAAVAQDGGQTVRAIYDQPMTGSPPQAQRNAAQMLKRHRTGALSSDALYGLRALACQVGDTVRDSNVRRSWNNKVFVVTGWALEPTGGDANTPPALTIRLRKKATLPSDYDYDPETEETDVVPSPRAAGSGVFTVATPVLGTLASGDAHLFIKADGTAVSRIYAPWSTITDYYVLQRGAVEVRYRTTGAGDAAWQVARRDDPSVSFVYLEPVEDGVSYDIQIRAVNGLGVASDWSAPTTHTVLGKGEAPPDVPTLYRVGAEAVWTYPSPPKDMAGFRARVVGGNSRNWSKGRDYPTDAALLTERRLPLAGIGTGVQTLMIKAVDTSGNLSANAASLVLGLGEYAPDNVVVTTDLKALGFPGTVTNGTLSGGNLVADDNGTLYLPDDDALYLPSTTAAYLPDTYKTMVYTSDYLPAAADVPGTAYMASGIAADGWRIAVRRRGSEDLYLARDDQLYLPDGGALYLGGPTEWSAFPGSLSIGRETVDFRITLDGGDIQGAITGLTISIDVPDVVESFDDVVITSTGTRLPITRSYRAIDYVGEITLQEDGYGATAVVVVDKDAVQGPLLKAIGATQATIDIKDLKGH